MTYNIITFGKKRENLEAAIERKIIGSYLGTFSEYLAKGSIIFLHCESKIWAIAKVSSDYFFNSEPIWQDKTYPHRFHISDVEILNEPVELTNGVYNVELRKRFGTGWAYKFLFSPKPLPTDIAETLLKDLKLQIARRPNQTKLPPIVANR